MNLSGATDLYDRWCADTDGIAASHSIALDIFASIHAAYDEPARVYHTLDHLRSIFSLLETVPDPHASSPRVVFAVWFHDLVYEPHRGDNEELSAQRAELDLVRLGAEADAAAAVAAMIRCTAGYAAIADPETALLLDADLAILGSEPGEYDKYRSAIRAEFAWVEEERYRTVRADVLRQFLDRGTIYSLPYFAERFEARALENIERELNELGAPVR